MIIRTSGLSLMIVSTSLVRPAALMPTTFVTTTNTMNPAFSSTTPMASIPGTREPKY